MIILFCQYLETFLITPKNMTNDKMCFVRNKRESLAEWTYKERVNRKWSQSELADRMGKNRAVVNKIEAANVDPTLETLESLAKAFGYKLTMVLSVLGYDVDTLSDQWIETQSFRLGQIRPDRRRMAERFIQSLLEDEESEDASSSAQNVKTSPIK